MPAVDIRARVPSTTSGRRKTSGHWRVRYATPDGQRFNARVLGQGTSSGLKLLIPEYQGANRIKDNVAAGTAVNQTNVYFSRG